VNAAGNPRFPAAAKWVHSGRAIALANRDTQRSLFTAKRFRSPAGGLWPQRGMREARSRALAACEAAAGCEPAPQGQNCLREQRELFSTAG